MKKPWVLSYPLSAQGRCWSDWADVQADLSSLGAHHFLGFVMLWVSLWYRPRQANLVLIAYTVSPEPPLLAHTSIESRGTFRQKARSLAPLNGWACAVKICHDGMLEDTNSLDGAHMSKLTKLECWMYVPVYCCCTCCLHGQISSICSHLCFCQCPP